MAETKYNTEKWRPVKDFEGYYEVSDHGRIKSLLRPGGHIRAPNLTMGYEAYTLTVKGVESRIYGHRAVAEAFIPNPNGARTVNHKDCNKLNNHVSNLEWATYGHNLRHAITAGRIPLGEKRPNARLTEEGVRIIRAASDDVTHNELARQLGVSNTVVRYARIGWTWTHVK